MQNLPKEIQDRFNELPEVVQDIILNSGWEKTTRHIVEKYNLRIDQGAVIEEETMFVMFGFDSADNFTENIMREAKVNKELADKITTDINNGVFKLITEKLVEVTTGNKDLSSFSPKKDEEEEVVNTPHTPVISKEQEVEEVVEDENTQEVPIDNNTDEKTSDNNPDTQNPLIEENLNNSEVKKPTSIDPYLEPIE